MEVPLQISTITKKSKRVITHFASLVLNYFPTTLSILTLHINPSTSLMPSPGKVPASLLHQCSKFLPFLLARSAAKEKRKSTCRPIYCNFSSKGHSFETQARVLPLEHCPPNQLVSHEIHWIRALNTVLPSDLNSQYSIT